MVRVFLHLPLHLSRPPFLLPCPSLYTFLSSLFSLLPPPPTSVTFFNSPSPPLPTSPKLSSLSSSFLYHHPIDQFLKEYLGSLPAKKNRGRRRASRHTSRTRHRRQPSLTKPMSSQPPSQGGTPPNTPGLFRQKVNNVTSRATLRSFQTEEEDRGLCVCA